MQTHTQAIDQQVTIGQRQLPGNLAVPQDARGIVLFAHGSGSSRLSPRNQYVAEVLQGGWLATLLFDLLDEDEAAYACEWFERHLTHGRSTTWQTNSDSTIPGSSRCGPAWGKSP